VAIGVAVADGLATVIGQGTWQIGVIVLLAMGTCIAIGGRPLFVVQAGTAAVLVAALPSADGTASLDRVLDTLSGGVAALLFTVVVLPVRPLSLVHRAATPVLDELARAFDQVGEGLRLGDPAIAERALEQARATGDHWAQLNEAVGVGRQAARIAPVRRHHAEELVDLAQTAVQLDYAIRDARILARVAWRLTETGTRWGERLGLVMEEFASAVRALEGHLAGEYDETLAARTHAGRAVRLASSVVANADDDFVLTHLVGQVRSTAVDLLRATGLSRSDAITAMLDAVGEAHG